MRGLGRDWLFFDIGCAVAHHARIASRPFYGFSN